MKANAIAPRVFTSLDAAIGAVGDRRNIDYLAVIGGKKDLQPSYAYGAVELRYGLRGRGFDEARGDSVTVWLPEREPLL